MSNDTTEASETQAPTNEYLQPLLDTMQGPFCREWMEAHEELRHRAFIVASELVRVRRENETLCAKTATLESATDALQLKLRILKEREDFFAKSLRVADGGQYRNDWPAAMDRVIRENETLRAQVAAHEDADRRWSADMAELRDELRAERDFRAQMVADRDARSGEPQ